MCLIIYTHSKDTRKYKICKDKMKRDRLDDPEPKINRRKVWVSRPINNQNETKVKSVKDRVKIYDVFIVPISFQGREDPNRNPLF